MVRLLKVTELEERREGLLRESGLCRQVLHSEIEAISLTSRQFKRRFRPFRSVWGVIAALAPVVLEWKSKKGLLARLFSGFSFATEIMSAINKAKGGSAEAHASEESSGVSRP